MDKEHQELADLLFKDMPARHLDAFVDGLGHVLDCLREGLRTAGQEAGSR